MRVLYGAGLQLGSTSEHRLRAFRRSISDDVIEFAFERYLASALPLVQKLTERVLMSPAITAINGALLRAVEEYQPDCVWLDKPIYFHAKTIQRLRANDVKVIAYTNDDPYGPRKDPVWRLFKSAIPHYWGHVVTRQVSRRELMEHGAVRVVCTPFAFEPSLHFPPEAIGLGTPKGFDVSFVGSPHDNRVQWITKLVGELPGVRFGLFGPGWHRHARRLRDVGLTAQPSVWNDQYREVIWRSKLSISFITRSNRDELSHKAIEIAACGTPVLVEHSEIHDRIFRHRESAYFFDDPSLLSMVIGDALSKDEELNAMGINAAKAVRLAKMSNDDVLSEGMRELGLVASLS